MKLRRKNPPPEISYDIWDAPSDAKKPTKIHPSQKRNKKAPLPHPGQSYNPDPKDHERLIQKVIKKELVHQRKQTLLNKAVKVKVDSRELRKHEKEELESGIKHLLSNQSDDIKSSSNKDAVASNQHGDDDGSSTDSAFSDYDEKDFEAITKDKAVVEKRKTRQQRLKQLKDKLQRKAAKLRKLNRIRLSRFDSIKKMMKELDKKEKEAAGKKKRRKKLKEERLGQRFEKSDPIYCLKDELPPNLRKVTCPMDSIVREQLESFQSRLMVEPSKYQSKKRKYKKVEFTRKTLAEADDA